MKVLLLALLATGVPQCETFEVRCARLGGYVEQRDCGIWFEWVATQTDAGTSAIALPVQKCDEVCVVEEP